MKISLLYEIVKQLCNDHHQAVHILGTLAFEAKYQLTINRLIIQTLKQWVIKTLKPFKETDIRL